MQFSDDEWLAFAQKLEKATKAGRLRWVPIDEDLLSNAYLALVPDNAVYTLSSRDGDGQFPFTLVVRDTEGVRISEFTTVAYTDSWDVPSEQAASMIIERLYGEVARIVTGAPERAEELLKGLDALIPDEDTF